MMYISKSMLIENYQGALDFLTKCGFEHTHWIKKHRYTTDDISKADVCVILLDSKVSTTKIGQGVLSEFLFCKENDIPIYILYKRDYDHTYNFYNIASVYKISHSTSHEAAGITFGNIANEKLNKYRMKPTRNTVSEKIETKSVSKKTEVIDEMLLLM